MQTRHLFSAGIVTGLILAGCSSSVTIPPEGQDTTPPEVEVNAGLAGRFGEVKSGGSAETFKVLTGDDVVLIASARDDGGVEVHRVTAVSGGEIDDNQSGVGQSVEDTGSVDDPRDALFTAGTLVPDDRSRAIELEGYGRDFSGNEATTPRLTVKYLEPVTPSINVSPDTVTQGQSVQVSWNVTGTNATGYTLEIPDSSGQIQTSNVSSSGSQSLIVDDPGSYQLSISAETELQQSGATSDTKMLDVQAPPSPEATLSGPSGDVCAGDDFQLSWSTSNADTAELTPPGQSVSLSGSMSQSVSTTTSYTLTATQQATGTTASASQTVDVFQPPADLDIYKTADTGSGGPGPDNWREATIDTQDITAQCGTSYPSITNVRYTGSQFPSTESIRIRFEPDSGSPRETRFFRNEPDTDEFDGMDPRGTWKLIYTGSPLMPTIPFKVTVE